MSAGIVCGNLPILAPIFGCVGPRRKRGTGRSTPIMLANFNNPLRRSEAGLNLPIEQNVGVGAEAENERTGPSLRRTETPSPLRLSFTGSEIELHVLSATAASRSRATPGEHPQALPRSSTRNLPKSSSQRLPLVLDRMRSRAGFESLG